MGDTFRAVVTDRGGSDYWNGDGAYWFVTAHNEVTEILRISGLPDGEQEVLFAFEEHYTPIGAEVVVRAAGIGDTWTPDGTRFRGKATVLYDAFLEKYVVTGVMRSPWAEERWRAAAWFVECDGSKRTVREGSSPAGSSVCRERGTVASAAADGEACRDAQRETVRRLSEMGRGLTEWYADRFGGAPPGPGSAVRVSHYAAVTAEEAEASVVPTYLERVERFDGWGRSLSLGLGLRGLGPGGRALLIRSRGSDGAFDTDDYRVGAFPGGDCGADIVWADGSLAKWPK
jgi:hypothetical protein